MHRSDLQLQLQPLCSYLRAGAWDLEKALLLHERFLNAAY